MLQHQSDPGHSIVVQAVQRLVLILAIASLDHLIIPILLWFSAHVVSFRIELVVTKVLFAWHSDCSDVIHVGVGIHDP